MRSTLFHSRPNAQGYVPGETPEMFRNVSSETLEFVRDNARHPARRQLAVDELARRAKEA